MFDTEDEMKKFDAGTAADDAETKLRKILSEMERQPSKAFEEARKQGYWLGFNWAGVTPKSDAAQEETPADIMAETRRMLK